ncbi:MAG: aldo/keto reductase [Deltaproteobacteria bacterium]|jgi:aryl-alcohol dehydrogenase-like predicted oxidoreductase|nr:aldo/keto reductase [Deltaproteobacteria bacterium]MBW2495967.1 aldo/keto reductase [Deltaproteobacteria bacterium]
METTILGRTGMRVSRLCLGCMSYGTPDWRPWVLDEHQARPFFKRAIEAGINFFDTSNFYSLGVSEEVTGRLVREFGVIDECVIATKVFFPLNERPNMGGLSRKHIQQACEQSLRRLGVEAIDLYQLHRLDPHTPIEETLGALDDLVRQGKVRHIGASSAYAWEIATALGVSDRLGLARFATMQNHYNLVYREEEREMLPLCETEEIAVIPWSPLARGLLAGSRRALRERKGSTRQETDEVTDLLYDHDSDWDVVEAVRALARERDLPPARIALAWLLSKPGVTAPIIGATKLPHLEDAIAALDVELSEKEIETLEAPYRPHPPRGLGPAALHRPTRRRD